MQRSAHAWVYIRTCAAPITSNCPSPLKEIAHVDRTGAAITRKTEAPWHARRSRTTAQRPGCQCAALRGTLDAAAAARARRARQLSTGAARALRHAAATRLSGGPQYPLPAQSGPGTLEHRARPGMDRPPSQRADYRTDRYR